jgi:CheY-like chemotaxis protein
VHIASSTAQLQDDIALILHRPFENLPLNAQAALQQLRRCDPLLAGKKVIVIDDDIRNIFSLTSALEEHGVELHYAESGRSGIEILQRVPDVDAVLVDIMMPGMDGYQTMQEIRSMPEFATLPVIAVTAKAMKGDRQKCIEAGASDYVAKPVDIDQLVSVLRVWFQRAGQSTPSLGTAGDNVVTFRSVAGQN